MQFKIIFSGAIVAGFCFLVLWLPIGSFNLAHEIYFKALGIEKHSTENFEYYLRNSENSQFCYLFIHGMGDQAFTWTKQASFEKGKNSYFLNLPGSGNSPPLTRIENYTLTYLAHLISDQMLTKCQQWKIIGNSFGGWLSILIAQQYPEKVNSLVLINPAGLKMDYSKIIEFYREPTLEKLKEFKRKIQPGAFLWPNFLLNAFVKKLKEIPTSNFVNAGANTPFLEDSNFRLSQKIELIWGTQDQLFPFHLSKNFKRTFPQAQIHKLTNCAHKAQLECENEVNKIVYSLKANPI